MKIRFLITLALMVTYQVTLACDACLKRQPKITQGITHGTGPESNWDWVIVGIVAVITLFTLFTAL